MCLELVSRAAERPHSKALRRTSRRRRSTEEGVQPNTKRPATLHHSSIFCLGPSCLRRRASWPLCSGWAESGASWPRKWPRKWPRQRPRKRQNNVQPQAQSARGCSQARLLVAPKAAPLLGRSPAAAKDKHAADRRPLAGKLAASQRRASGELTASQRALVAAARRLAWHSIRGRIWGHS